MEHRLELIDNVLVRGNEVFTDSGWLDFAANRDMKGRFSKYKNIGKVLARHKAPEPDPAISDIFRRMFLQQKKAVLTYLQNHPTIPKTIPPFDFVGLNFSNLLQNQMLKNGHNSARQALATLGVKDEKKYKSTEYRMGVAAQKAAEKALKTVNATTAKKLDETLKEFKKDVVLGNVKGDQKKALQNRIRAVYSEAQDKRLPIIAEYETSSAEHIGGDIAAKESGAFTSKKWMVDGNPCPECVRLSKMGPIGINDSFTVTNYGRVYHPPLHPLCKCGIRWLKT